MREAKTLDALVRGWPVSPATMASVGDRSLLERTRHHMGAGEPREVDAACAGLESLCDADRPAGERGTVFGPGVYDSGASSIFT